MNNFLKNIFLSIFAIAIFSVQANTAHAMESCNNHHDDENLYYINRNLNKVLENASKVLRQKTEKLKTKANSSFKAKENICKKIAKIERIILKLRLEIYKAQDNFYGTGGNLFKSLSKEHLKYIETIQDFTEANLGLFSCTKIGDWIKHQWKIIDFYLDVSRGCDIDFARKRINKIINELKKAKSNAIIINKDNQILDEMVRLNCDLYIMELENKLKELSDTNCEEDILLCVKEYKN